MDPVSNNVRILAPLSRSLSLLCFPLYRHQFQGRLSQVGAVITTGLQVSVFLVRRRTQAISFPGVPANIPRLGLIGLTGSYVHH